MEPTADTPDDAAQVAALVAKLDDAVARLAQASDFAKATRVGPVLDLSRRVLAAPTGAAALYDRVAVMEDAGVFNGTDWATPEILQASLAAHTLKHGEPRTVALECLNQMRLLAVAQRDYFHPRISSEQAQHFLAQTLGLNLDLLFGHVDEVTRRRPALVQAGLANLYGFVVERIGYGRVLDQVIDEIWRILAQRPILVTHVKAMITQVSIWLAEHPSEGAGAGWGADRLISAVFGPTAGCREDPGLDAYAARLDAMDGQALANEAGGCARAMHDTGLVSPYHAVLLRHLVEVDPDLLSAALGLSSTGVDALRTYSDLVHALIAKAVHPETCQAIYGLALMLERGILYIPAIAPALWRQLHLPLSAYAAETMRLTHGDARPAEVWLLGGVLSMLGQPLGVGQGNNPTCQSARALSMWSFADPDYLLQLVAWAARDDEIVIEFEGVRLSSRALAAGMASLPPSDLDPVSTVLVPHLDRIYVEMGRMCADRGDDPHRWVNPELHGWWVGRGYDIAVDVATGELHDHDGFVRRFYAAYHPFYNGNQAVIHPQPAGIAVTDGAARYVGWHAIAIYRVAIDQEGAMRVYFYNPNNDSGQDWGDGVEVSTEGRGERFGESSLPIDQFASRLYLYHFDPLERGEPEAVPADEVAQVGELARRSWAADR